MKTTIKIEKVEISFETNDQLSAQAQPAEAAPQTETAQATKEAKAETNADHQKKTQPNADPFEEIISMLFADMLLKSFPLGQMPGDNPRFRVKAFGSLNELLNDIKSKHNTQQKQQQ